MKKKFTNLLLSFFAVTSLWSQNEVLKPMTDKPVYFDISPPLRDMVQLAPEMFDATWKDGVVFNFTAIQPGNREEEGVRSDPVLQEFDGDLPSDTTIQNFEGLPNVSGFIPPDTHGEAGLSHFFQTVNCSFAVYNKSGARILGPLANSSVWAGMPNNDNSGDAIILYDEQANRWLFSQFSLPNGSSTAPYFQMIAVSQTSDPTGPWYRYQYEFSSMPDYPKFGIWPDGYYMATNNFGPSPNGWVGNGAFAFDRDAMLAGEPEALRVSFIIPPGADGFISPLPSDCDGIFPAYGTPNYFIYIRTNSPQRLGVYQFHVDWSNPAASTFGNLSYLNVASFSTGGAAGNGIPQLGTDKKLETLADRLMYRLQYRKFNGYGSMVVNHTVNSGSGPAGVRWYELRDSGTGWSIYQQATYAPGDGHSRWMGSIAQDTAGTIALGYSVSGPALYPSIRYTGRYKNDPLNQMTLAEKTIIHGGGCQTGIWSGRSRWGDYSGMSIDPAAPTTFWYTTEYYGTTSTSNWQTRIASFTFGNVFSTAASATPTLLCSSSNDSVQLKAYGYGGSGTYTYNWNSIPAGFTSTISNPKVKPTESTVYYVTTSDGSIQRTDTVKVTFNLAPIANAGNDTTVCWYTPSIAMNAMAQNYSKIAWGTGGDGSFTHPNAVETDYIPGIKDKTTGHVDLKMMVIPIAPCTSITMDMIRLYLDPCTGTNEKIADNAGLRISPNPAKSNASLSMLKHTGAFSLTILNSAGKQIFYENITSPKDQEWRRTIDLSGWPSGIYLVRMDDGNNQTSARLVVNNE